MSDFSSSESPAAAGEFAGIVRLIRRICLFREQGEVERAERLHRDELISAVAAYRLWHGPESLTEEKLCVIFLHEKETVREAMALAAVVVPDLARIVPPSSGDSASVFPQTPKMGSLKPFPDNPPAIGELLDAMMAAEPPEERPARPNGNHGGAS